jgi:hypothetical protein
MNALEKMIAWGLRPRGSVEYIEQGDVTVEIIHVHGVSEGRNVVGDRIATSRYSKYPLTIQRPAVEKTAIAHQCGVCGARLMIEVQSKESLMKMIKPASITFAVSILLFAIGAIFHRPQKGLTFMDIVLISGLFLSLASAAALFFLLPMEYQKMGIGDVIDKHTIKGGRNDYFAHRINQTPQK